MIDPKTELPGLSWAEASARRLSRSGLLSPTQDAQPAEIVRRMCGAHAQVMSAAELSIGLRMAEGTQSDIREALWDQHSLVKTYGPRGTVHLLPTQDLPMWCGALSAAPYERAGDTRRDLLTPEQVETIIEAIAVVLAETELTTDELTKALMDQVGPWAGDPVMPAFQTMWPRWRLVQAIAGIRGAMCFGPNRGRNVTYTSPRRWLPGFKPAVGQTALADLVNRYLYAYGPATPQQFAQWLAVPPRWAAELFDSLSDTIQPVEFNGGTAWVVSGDTSLPDHPPQVICLLPYFDAYVVASHPRALLYPGQAAARALTGGQAGNLPVLLIDGTVAGVWNQRRAGQKIDITVEPLAELTAAQRKEIDNQVERIGKILEGKARWRIGTVTTGPHA